MTDDPFAQILLREGDKERSITLEEYRAIPLQKRCTLLVQGRIRFVGAKGGAVPTKDALRWLAHVSAKSD